MFSNVSKIVLFDVKVRLILRKGLIGTPNKNLSPLLNLFRRRESYGGLRFAKQATI